MRGELITALFFVLLVFYEIGLSSLVFTLCVFLSMKTNKRKSHLCVCVVRTRVHVLANSILFACFDEVCLD